jgi:uncharacterized membrane protein YoaK (UPF0700 family)
MITFLTEIRETIAPHRASRYGLLPPLLIGLTVVTGLVDAFSYLVLGHVFVANMTGNVVFVGFALAGVGGFSIVASIIALTAFAAGALCGGMIASRLSARAGALLPTSAAAQLALLAVAVVLSGVAGEVVTGGVRYGLIATLALAMGVQNAAARRLAVPDLTTSVLTMTLTGLASDARVAGGEGSRAGRRLIAIAAMLLGALAGAILIVKGHSIYPLAFAAAGTAVIAVVSRRTGRGVA